MFERPQCFLVCNFLGGLDVKKHGDSGTISGFFFVTFAGIKLSLYSDTYTYTYGLTQATALAYHYDDIERMLEVRRIVESEHGPKLFAENPNFFWMK